MQKVETWLPIFPGFYNTGFFDEDEFYHEIDQYKEWFFSEHPNLKQEAVDDAADEKDPWGGLIKWDNKQFEEDSARAACEWVESTLNDIFVPYKEQKRLWESSDHPDGLFYVNFQKVVSPREYNFANDCVNCEIEYPGNEPLLKYIAGHWDHFAEYIKDNYTSCDGFRSRYSNDPDNWLDPACWNDHQYGAVFDFIVRDYMKERLSEDLPELYSMYEHVAEQIYYNDYLDFDDYEKLALEMEKEVEDDKR